MSLEALAFGGCFPKMLPVVAIALLNSQNIMDTPDNDMFRVSPSCVFPTSTSREGQENRKVEFWRSHNLEFIYYLFFAPWLPEVLSQ